MEKETFKIQINQNIFFNFETAEQLHEFLENLRAKIKGKIYDVSVFDEKGILLSKFERDKNQMPKFILQKLDLLIWN